MIFFKFGNFSSIARSLCHKGDKLDFWDFLGFQKCSISSNHGHLGAPRGAPKVQKCVSGASPVIIEQLDHYVVFETTYNAVQDFQRGKKCPKWVNLKTP